MNTLVGIIVGIIGLVFSILGLLIWRNQKISLLHNFYYDKVKIEGEHSMWKVALKLFKVCLLVVSSYLVYIVIRYSYYSSKDYNQVINGSIKWIFNEI